MDWAAELQAEFEQAESARAGGNEGRARVCARRAAGIAVREFLVRRGEAVPGGSAYDLLQLLAARTGLDPGLRQAAVYLTLRVDEEFKLPVYVDLFEQARGLCAGLLGSAK